MKILSLTILTASFVANLATIYYFQNIPVAFYYPHTRAWELMTGAVLSQIALKHNEGSNLRLPITKGVASVAGLILLGCGFLFIREATFFPGYWALLPVLGTSALIISDAEIWFARIILTNRVIVWFGTISYALYLWHFPLLFLLRQLLHGPTNKPLTVSVVMLSIAIAWATTRLLEKPIRFGVLRRIHSRFYLLTLATSGLIVVLSLLATPEPKSDTYILQKIEA
ncbi:MAG: acyltransferase, partial [Actinobacteria bacterium]|nr:acyltransferase [Actinomycetota bacterium]